MVKNFVGPIEENYPIVSPKIIYILFNYCDFIFLLYLPILKVHVCGLNV